MSKKRSLNEYRQVKDYGYTPPINKGKNSVTEINHKYIVDLTEVELSDLELVGGKNASLGEMIQNLSKLGVNIPGGFALTVEAYWEFINHNKLDKKIRSLIKKMKKDDLISLKKTGLEIRQLIRNGKWPRQVKEEIMETFSQRS